MINISRIGMLKTTLPFSSLCVLALFGVKLQALEFTTHQSIYLKYAHDAVTEDFNGDGYLDILVAIRSSLYSNRLLLNDGEGNFTDHGELPIGRDTYALASGDFDHDGDIDFVAGNLVYGGDRLWLNDGQGNFSPSTQQFASEWSNNTLDIVSADFNADGHLDLMFANIIGPNTVWFNNGQGQFSDSGQRLGNAGSNGLTIADIDLDGDLDVITANQNNRFTADYHNQIWINNGQGTFFAGRRFDAQDSRDVAVGDLDGDGDLDIVAANSVNKYGEGTSKVWISGCEGQLIDTGQKLQEYLHYAYDVELKDIDLDGDLDLYLSFSGSKGDILMLNNGTGFFEESGYNLDQNTLTFHSIIEDFNYDGVPDIFSFNGFKDSTLRLGHTNNVLRLEKQKPLQPSLTRQPLHLNKIDFLQSDPSDLNQHLIAEYQLDQENEADEHEIIFGDYRELIPEQSEENDFIVTEEQDFLLTPDGGLVNAPEEFTLHLTTKMVMKDSNILASAHNSQNQGKPILLLKDSADFNETHPCAVTEKGFWLHIFWSNHEQVLCPTNHQVTQEQWQNLTLTYQNQSLRLYFDGILNQEFTLEHPLAAHDQLRFDGLFSHINLYKKSLSVDEVGTLL